MDGADRNSNNNNGNYDPFDPFSEKEDTFDTKKIRRSKASQLKRRSAKPPKVITDSKKSSRPSLLSRLKVFFKELPNRTDRYRFYRTAVIIFASIVGVVVLYALVLSPKIAQEVEKHEETNAEILLEDVRVLLESKDKIANDEYEKQIEEYENKLKSAINNNPSDADSQYRYMTALLRIFEDENRTKEAIELEEEFLNKNTNITLRINILQDLMIKYESLGMDKEYKKTIERFLELPEDEEVIVDGATIQQMKEQIKKLLESGDGESDQ
ncbi:hypothetical protein IJH66_01950 [Candidatus Saccharibacteria bacterium]|nr:hypothetical protein [Candidatus Saccharibacteria bacterium]